jgi:uncharacterized protein
MSTKPQTLSDVLFGKIRGGVLALLYGWTDKAFYVRQIARHLHASPGAVRRELEKLAAVDLIVRTCLGNQVFYQVNRHHPVFSEMRALVNKTVGIFNTLRAAIDPLGDQVRVAFVYGSIARQEEKADSDIDLMIIGDIELDDVLARFPEAESAVGRPINPTVYSIHEFKRKLEDGNHFLNAVINDKKVFLFGTEDEFREMAGVRMVKARAQQRKRNQSIGRHRPAKSR